MRNLVVESDAFKNMALDVATIRAGIAAGFSGGGSGTSAGPVVVGGSRFDWHDHADAVRRRVPPTWTFPHVSLITLYKYWHCGDEVNRVSPMRDFTPTDVGFLGGRAKINLTDVKFMCKVIDEEAIRQGKTPRRYMSHADAGSCFHAGKLALGVPATTPTGKSRNLASMKWSSALRYMTKKRKD